MLRKINPLDLKGDDDWILGQCLIGLGARIGPNDRFKLKKDVSYGPIEIRSKNNPLKMETIYLQLDHDITRRKRKRFNDEYRYEVSTNLIGSGLKGKIYNVERTLAHDLNGGLISKKKSRVSKIMKNPAHGRVENEMRGLEQFPYTHAKPVLQDKDEAEIIMKKLNGETLKDIVVNKEQIDQGKLLDICINLYKCLDILHSQNLNDLTDENILCYIKNGEAYLIDFDATNNNIDLTRSLTSDLFYMTKLLKKLFSTIKNPEEAKYFKKILNDITGHERAGLIILSTFPPPIDIQDLPGAPQTGYIYTTKNKDENVYFYNKMENTVKKIDSNLDDIKAAINVFQWEKEAEESASMNNAPQFLDVIDSYYLEEIEKKHKTSIWTTKNYIAYLENKKLEMLLNANPGNEKHIREAFEQGREYAKKSKQQLIENIAENTRTQFMSNFDKINDDPTSIKIFIEQADLVSTFKVTDKTKKNDILGDIDRVIEKYNTYPKQLNKLVDVINQDTHKDPASEKKKKILERKIKHVIERAVISIDDLFIQVNKMEKTITFVETELANFSTNSMDDLKNQINNFLKDISGAAMNVGTTTRLLFLFMNDHLASKEDQLNLLENLFTKLKQDSSNNNAISRFSKSKKFQIAVLQETYKYILSDSLNKPELSEKEKNNIQEKINDPNNIINYHVGFHVGKTAARKELDRFLNDEPNKTELPKLDKMK